MMWTSPNLARWQVKQWAFAIVSLLLVTLTPLGWIQWQQFKLLDNVSDKQVDSLMWQAYQLEREMTILNQFLHEGVASPGKTDPWVLSERYEVFLSRIDLRLRPGVSADPGFCRSGFSRDQARSVTPVAAEAAPCIWT